MKYLIAIEGVPQPDEEIFGKILEEIHTIKSALHEGYNTSYAALYAPKDSNAREEIKKIVTRIQKKNPTLLMIVGIGGSNMGTLAVVQALKGNFLNDMHPALRFYCADTIDNDYSSALLAIFERELVQGNNSILCIVTKSGTTTETVINGGLFLEMLKKYRPADYAEQIVYITDNGSPLVAVAEKQGAQLLKIPTKVGGRFSIFTAVGLFPLGLLGIDTEEFCRGASAALDRCLDEQGNDAALSAATLFTQYNKGYLIHDIFSFSPDTSMLAHWYKQLIGESLGKKHDKGGRVVEMGITPTVSVGTVDLHSVAQLYLAGPHNRITTFIHRSEEPHRLTIPYNECTQVIQGLAGAGVSFVKEAIFKGVLAAYKNEQRPYMVIDIEDKKSYALGAFMMMKIIETLFLAKLFNINPFDQPAVELYKAHTRKFLSMKEL